MNTYGTLALTLLLTVIIAMIAHYLLFKFLNRLSRRTENITPESLNKHLSQPARVFILTIALYFSIAPAKISPDFQQLQGLLDGILHFLSLLIIACVFWLFVRATSVLQDSMTIKFDILAADNLTARKVHTQLRVLMQIVIVLSIILAVATMLMTFPKVRQLGTTILASAGIIGIVVGMAAQKTIGNFIAGIQIAITQPIRLDDVVIVENEWGKIEEITLTYVVVKIWDSRRLIVPISYFIDNPFQNWTRTSADILGTVFIYTDYSVPIDEIRKELQNILNASDLWDKKVCVLQVTNATEKCVELRALVSASDASKAWTLRCNVREKLIDFMSNNYPDAMPKFRIETKPV
ncbi:MAG: mechanosensitive ion channel [Candidatus Brocadiia bacterium]|nr:MAG: mechanosensitive ion channel [Candidatus Brocadiia bacterium]